MERVSTVFEADRFEETGQVIRPMASLYRISAATCRLRSSVARANERAPRTL